MNSRVLILYSGNSTRVRHMNAQTCLFTRGAMPGIHRRARHGQQVGAEAEIDSAFNPESFEFDSEFAPNLSEHAHRL